MNGIAIVWVVLAVVFLVGEIFTAGFFLACFAVGATAAAVLAVLGVRLPWQLAAFVFLSAAAVAGSRRFAERVTGSQPVGVAADRVLGKRAVVLEAIDPLTGTGRVRVEREEWRAEAEDGGSVPAGAEVEVLAVEGAHLVVRWRGRGPSTGDEGRS